MRKIGRPKGSKNKPKENNNIVSTISTPSGTKTVQEIQKDIQKFELENEERLNRKFAKVQKSLQLVDLTKTENRTYSTYSREVLRTYLKNPKSYESSLRNVSRYLYRQSYEYRRFCVFYATMICGDAFSITPLVDSLNNTSEESLLDNYFTTLTRWQRMDFANELVKLLITAWREDAVYAYVYDDSDQEGGTCFFHILDGDYCRVSAVENGVCRFAFDFSYFKKYPNDLEYWDSEFKQKYNKYDKNSSLRWQELEPSRQICLKVNMDDPKMDYPPFAGLMESVISLLNLREIQDTKDALSIYKLLVARLKPLNSSTEPDNFEVDIDTAIQYFNKLSDALPPEVDACISPLPIEPFEFKNLNNSDDTDMLSSSMSNVFKSIGGVILDNSKTGTTIYESQIICDMKMAHSTLVPQINRWLNTYFNYVIGTNHATIKYIDGVSPYTRKAKRKELLESAQNGLPTILEISVLDGSTPQETISKLQLQKALGLPDILTPLQTSYTLTSSDTDPNTGGRPTNDTTDLTDSGSATRERM